MGSERVALSLDRVVHSPLASIPSTRYFIAFWPSSPSSRIVSNWRTPPKSISTNIPGRAGSQDRHRVTGLLSKANWTSHGFGRVFNRHSGDRVSSRPLEYRRSSETLHIDSLAAVCTSRTFLSSVGGK